MITEFDPSKINNYYIDSKDDIPIIDSVLIDKYNYGRIDLICLKYYGNINYLMLLLDYNDITDITDIKLNQVLKIPDMVSVINNLVEMNNEDDIQINGIYTHDSLFDNEKLESLKKLRNNNSPTTNALPKLNIKLDKVKYNDKTGEIIL